MNAFLLAFGMEILISQWYDEAFFGIFLNNFLFSIGFGLPAYIVLTRDGSLFSDLGPLIHSRCGLPVLERLSGKSRWLYVADSILLLACAGCVLLKCCWSNRLLVRLLCMVTVLMLILSCLVPSPLMSQGDGSFDSSTI